MRSTIKEGEHKGKKGCTYCYNKPKTKKVYAKTPSKASPEFFSSLIPSLEAQGVCENCGCRLNVNYNPFWNMAHILPKSKYKSVAEERLNILFLCSQKDWNTNRCHERFDSGPSTRKEMPVYELSRQRYEQFKDKVTEVGIETLDYEKHTR
jgi:hypothetical protein